MDVLPINFGTLYYCGVWSANDRKYWLMKMIYRTFVVILIFCMTLSEIIELTMSENIAHMTECLFLTLTITALCVKMINFISKQKSMNCLLNEFRSEICQPRNSDEEKILLKYQTRANNIFKTLGGLAVPTGLLLISVPIANKKRELPLRGYQLVSLEHTLYFVVAYFFQAVGIIISILVNVSLDILLAGLILLVCGQFELCSHRIMVSSKNQSFGTIKEYIRHHVIILKIVRRIQSFFILVAVILFMLSLLTICTSLFQLPQKKVGSVEFCTLVMYLSCLLCQLFIYCWFGNELQLKSLCVPNALYNSDWTALLPIQRRVYYTSMLANQKKLCISFYGIFSLSLQTYVWILKTSYAIFNLLESNSSI